MKKNKYFIFLLIIMFFNIHSVNAVDHSLIYNIDSFDITDDGIIDIDGWAFIDHVDNLGGQNMQSFIVAYSGDAWDDSVSFSTYCGQPENSCALFQNALRPINKGKEVDVKTYRTDFNMFFTRCTGSGCKYSVYSNHFDNINNNKDIYDSNCTSDGNYGGSHCLYSGVSFTNQIKLEEIYRQLGGAQDVKFKIRVVAKYGTTKRNLSNRNKFNTFDRVAGFGISLGSIKNSRKCSSIKKCSYKLTKPFSFENNGVKYTVKEVNISGLLSDIYFTAISATAKKNYQMSTNVNGGPVSYNRDYDLVFNGDNDGLSRKPVCGWVKYSSQVKGYCVGTKSYAIYAYEPNWSTVPDKNHKHIRYVPIAWARPKANTSITISSDTDSERIESCICLGGQCSTTGNNDALCKAKTYVDYTTCPPDQEHNGCSNANFDVTCKYTQSGTYYYRMKVSDFLEKAKNDPKLLKIGAIPSAIIEKDSVDVNTARTQVLIPIVFAGDISYHQTGNLSFYKEGNYGTVFANNRIPVNSGRPFNFAVLYNVSANWGSISGSTQYNTHVTVDVVTNKGSKTLDVYFALSPDDKIYSKSWGEPVGTVSEMYDVVTKAKSIDEKAVDSLSFVASFPNSNTKESDLTKAEMINPGDFNCNVTGKSNNSLSATCKYIIRKAYIDSKTSDISYLSEVPSNLDALSNDGSLYYIPLYMNTGDDFQFDLIGDRLSLFDKVDFTYKGTCKLKKVTNRIKEVVYRPIDINNPFPKASSVNEYPINWKEYASKDKGLTRLVGSFAAKSYETKLLTSSDMKGLDDKYGDYMSREEFKGSESTGQSAIVHTSLFDSIRARTGKNFHCGLGEFNDSCDKKQT